MFEVAGVYCNQTKANINYIHDCELFLQHKKLPKDPTQVTDTSIGDPGKSNLIVSIL